MAGPWEQYQAKPAAKPAAKPQTPAAKPKGRFEGLAPARAQQILTDAEAKLSARLGNFSEAQRRRQFQRFYANPGIQDLRRAAGLAPMRTRQEEVQAIARERVTSARGKRQDRETQRTLGQTLRGIPGVGTVAGALVDMLPTETAAGAGEGLLNTFGVGPRIRSAGNYLQSLFGGDKDASYSREFEVAREEARIRRERAPIASTAGEVAGGFAGGLGAAKVVDRGVRAVGAVAPRAANVLQRLVTTQPGQRVRNATKIIAAGGAGGAAQAAGEGSDVGTGTLYGAGGAAVLGGGFKAAEVLSRPVRDVLRMTSADTFLRRLTGSSREQIAARAAEYRNATGAEPTVFELLPLADRNRILGRAVTGRDEIVEQVSGAVRQRAQNLGPEMARRADEITAPQRQFVERGMRQDMARARGEATPEDAALAARATRSPTDMLELRQAEVQAIMAPFDNVRVVDSLDNLMPIAPRQVAPGQIVEEISDPEVAAVIRSAAGTMRQRGAQEGVTVADISDIMRRIRPDLERGGIEGRNAQRALDHLQGVLDDNAPAAGQAAREATAAYAARSRMAEGVREGAATRLRDRVQVGTSNREARRIRNAYDTPEGSAGRVLGQSGRILDDLSGSPEEALRATVGMSRNSIGREVAQNIGPREADDLMRAARMQDESAQALASAARQAQSGQGAQQLDSETLAQTLVSLHPASFVTTKASAIRRLMDMSYMPESRARTVAEMLFSQDPALTRRAIDALRSDARGSTALGAILGMLSTEVAETPLGDNLDDIPDEPDPVTLDEEMPADEGEAGPWGDYSQESEAPYGRQVIEAVFPGAVVTDDRRDPNSDLGRKNPGSEHVISDGAVDVRPIPGMTFEEFIDTLKREGYEIIEAIDEVKNPSGHATGPHWHVVFA